MKILARPATPTTFTLYSIAHEDQGEPTRREMPSSRMIVAVDRTARKLRAAVALLESGSVNAADVSGTLRECIGLLDGRVSS